MAIAVVFVACGDDSSDDQPVTTSAAEAEAETAPSHATSEPTDPGEEDGNPEDSVQDGGSRSGRATITIAGETVEFGSFTCFHGDAAVEAFGGDDLTFAAIGEAETSAGTSIVAASSGDSPFGPNYTIFYSPSGDSMGEVWQRVGTDAATIDGDRITGEDRSSVSSPGKEDGMRRLTTFALCILLVITACGGSPGTEDESGGSAANTTTVEEDQPSGSHVEADDSGNYAVVSIGGETFEVPADPLNICNSLDNLIFGSFAMGASGNVVQAGGPDVAMQINFNVPVTDWEAHGLQPPGIDVDMRDEGVRWWANQSRDLGSVESWELTDGMASGRASFVAEDATGDQVGTESGTFEVLCAP